MRFYAHIIAGLILVAAFTAGAPSYAHAQDTNAAPPDEVSALPDRYIKEMEGFFAYCKEDDYLAKNFDCRCLSVEYIDKRTEKGAAATSSDIIKAMKKEQCRYGQENNTLPDGTPEEDYSDIPDEYIEEANNFYENCNATYEMDMNYDCECLSTKFLDMRIKNGPDMPPDTILMYLSTECPNTAGAAAHIYTQCEAQAPILPLYDMSVEDFCECTANTFAKIYKDAHISAGSQQYTSLRSSAMMMCTELPGGLKFPNMAERP